MLGFLAVLQKQRQTFLSCRGDVSGRHHVRAASARVDDHPSGAAAPDRIFLSVIEPPAVEIRYRCPTWSTSLDVD